MIPLSLKIVTLSKILFSLLFLYASPFCTWRNERRAINIPTRNKKNMLRNKTVFLEMGFSIRPSNCCRSKFCKFFESRKISSGSTRVFLSFLFNIFRIIVWTDKILISFLIIQLQIKTQEKALTKQKLLRKILLSQRHTTNQR